MKLDQSEIASSAWQKTLSWAHSELSRHRTKLETDISDVQSAKLRGQIAALKELIKLGEEDAPRPVVESNDHLYPR